MGIPDHLTCILRNLYAGQEAKVRTGHRRMDWFQIGKKYIKAVYRHSAYLTSMQSTSWEMPGWMKHKLGSTLPWEISITTDAKMIPPYGRKWRGIKRLLMEVKEESEKAGLKLNIQKKKIMASGPIFMVNRWGNNGNKWQTLFSWVPKLMQMMTTAMKLEGPCSLEEKLWAT